MDWLDLPSMKAGRREGRQEGKQKQPGVFLGWELNLGPFANTAALKSDYPLFIPLPEDRACLIVKLYISFPWGLRSTCAAASMMT